MKCYPRTFRCEKQNKWGFKYWHPKDREWIEDFGYETLEEAEAYLAEELEELQLECEGELDG